MLSLDRQEHTVVLDVTDDLQSGGPYVKATVETFLENVFTRFMLNFRVSIMTQLLSSTRSFRRYSLARSILCSDAPR